MVLVAGIGGYVRIKDGKSGGRCDHKSWQEYIPNTTETDINGNVKQVIPDPNASYDGEISYVTSLDDLVVQNTGFGYSEGDSITIDGGDGKAEVELNIQNGLIVGANVVNGGFGFTSLPDVTINSDTGVLAKLTPVLKFTKIDDASQLAQVSQDSCCNRN